jgi:hypothetical protein
LIAAYFTNKRLVIVPGPGNAFWARFGDWFGWTSVLALTTLLAGAPGGCGILRARMVRSARSRGYRFS